jgi:ubiquinone biosynthesis protein
MGDVLLDLRRIGTLLRVLVKYGLVPSLAGRFGRRSESGAVRFRHMLEELGVTYVKLGQYLAIRRDLMPEAAVRELQQLFERVAPIPFEQVRTIVERELGGPLERFFQEFDRAPTAAASVAQVHAAILPDGQRVAVKVQRPNIRRIFLSDIRTLVRLATLVDVSGLLGTLAVREIIEEFAAWTLPELDFQVEANTAERLSRTALAYERVPRIYWELTTPRVLTMEFLEGISLREVAEAFEAAGEAGVKARLPNVDLALVLHRLSVALMTQLYERGFFHGDPHPGNILIRDDNTVGFVDFGIFGDLTNYDRTIIRRHVAAIAVGNIPESLRFYMKQLELTPETDERGFRDAAAVLLHRWYQASVHPETSPDEDRHLGRYTLEMLDLVRRYGLRMRLSTLLFWRALNLLDSTTRGYPGYFDLLTGLREFFQPGPGEIAERLVELGLDTDRTLAVAELTRDEPEQLTRLYRAVLERQGKFGVQLVESASAYRANNRRARGAALALIGLSLALVSLGAPYEAAVRTAAMTLAMPLAVWSLLELSH